MPLDLLQNKNVTVNPCVYQLENSWSRMLRYKNLPSLHQNLSVIHCYSSMFRRNNQSTADRSSLMSGFLVILILVIEMVMLIHRFHVNGRYTRSLTIDKTTLVESLQKQGIALFHTVASSKLLSKCRACTEPWYSSMTVWIFFPFDLTNLDGTFLTSSRTGAGTRSQFTIWCHSLGSLQLIVRLIPLNKPTHRFDFKADEMTLVARCSIILHWCCGNV